MVSFQCESCGDVLTKKKLDGHRNRCWDASFTCLDCMTQFYGDGYRTHTSCMTEAQKYQGALHKDKKSDNQRRKSVTPLPAYVTDEDENPNSTVKAVAKVDVPPPAPSPPPNNASAPTPPVNVFDFLVGDNPPPPSPSAASTCSTCQSHGSGSYRDDQEHLIPYYPPQVAPMPPPPPPPIAAPNGTFYQHVGYVYGDGPVEKTLNRFDSDFDFQMHGSATPGRDNLGYAKSDKDFQTPIPPPNAPPAEHANDSSRSDKKRKRANVEDLDLSKTRSDQKQADRAVLHSGLTGGLKALLGGARERSFSDQEEPSPLSPKKRSKHSSRDHRHEPSKKKSSRRHRGDEEGRRPKAIEGRKDLKAIEYHHHRSEQLQSPQKSSTQSHSEFFLSLIDKDHHSVKGQSIWGALKMFHEGIGTDTLDGVRRATSAQEREEKRLFRGLRVKINRHGEIVLFSRPDAED